MRERGAGKAARTVVWHQLLPKQSSHKQVPVGMSAGENEQEAKRSEQRDVRQSHMHGGC
jgi:hypothetical protein